jgi:hypothetical protein
MRRWPVRLAVLRIEAFQSSLGYEPYDARLRRLAWSLVAALASVNRRGVSTPNLGVSRVVPYPAASRAQNLVRDALGANPDC